MCIVIYLSAISPRPNNHSITVWSDQSIGQHVRAHFHFKTGYRAFHPEQPMLKSECCEPTVGGLLSDSVSSVCCACRKEWSHACCVCGRPATPACGRP